MAHSNSLIIVSSLPAGSLARGSVPGAQGSVPRFVLLRCRTGKDRGPVTPEQPIKSAPPLAHSTWCEGAPALPKAITVKSQAWRTAVGMLPLELCSVQPVQQYLGALPTVGVGSETASQNRGSWTSGLESWLCGLRPVTLLFWAPCPPGQVGVPATQAC